jgi:hypothetical protein
MAICVVAVGLAGCGSVQQKEGDMADRLAAAERENRELKQSIDALEEDVQMRSAQVRDLEARSSAPVAAGGELLPPQAKAGECYARVFVPPQYRTATKTMLKREAGERIETLPAKYAMVEERVLVKEASEELKVIPAKYNWVEERVLVKEASSRLEQVPAKYETVSEKVLVRKGYTTWKKGRGPIERIDDATGEIMCLVEVPAEYKTVTKRVLSQPASVREVAIPAQYKTIRKRVLVEPAKTTKVSIPAQYETITVRKMVEPPKQRKIEIPPEYQQVTERELLRDGRMEWREILCETNTSPGVIKRLQAALKSAGYNPGPIDGVIGDQTMQAVNSFQKANGMAQGQLTIATLRKLKVM